MRFKNTGYYHNTQINVSRPAMRDNVESNLLWRIISAIAPCGLKTNADSKGPNEGHENHLMLFISKKGRK